MGRFTKAGLLAAGLLAALPAWAFPPIHRWVLANGTQVYFMESREIPLIDVVYTFDAGADRDPPGQAGIAALTTSLVGQATKTQDVDTIDRTLDGLGAAYGGGADEGEASYSIDMLATPSVRDAVVAETASVFDSARFPDAAFARKRRAMLIGLAAEQESVSYVARRTFRRALYPGQIYGHPLTGTVHDLKALTVKDVARFYHRHYVGKRLVLALVGDIGLAGAHRLAEQLAGGLPAGTPPSPLPAVRMPAHAVTIHRRFPSHQTQILIGTPTVSRADPDYFPMVIANHILGGNSITSRLGAAIRAQRGLSYDASSSLGMSRRAAPLVIGILTPNAQVPEVMKIARATLARLVTEGPTAEEVAHAKDHLVRSHPLDEDSDAKLVETLSVIGYYHLPLDDLAQFPRWVEAVTPAQVKSALRAHVPLDRLVTVTVGGRS